MTYDPRFPQQLQQYVPSVSLRSVIRDNAYQYRSDRGWVWLQKLAIKILKWRRCEYLETVEVKTYHPLQAEALHTQICEAIDGTEMDHREPHTLVIGAEDFQDLLGLPEAPQFLQYEAGPFKHGSDRYRVFGVKVRVCPWIKGWAII